MDVSQLLDQGARALAAGHWEEARDAFDAALEVEATAPALLGAADARWWLADASGCVTRMERAYALLRRAGEIDGAVTTAVWLSVVYFKTWANRAAASGWSARAASVLRDAGSEEDAAGRLHGWVLLAQAFHAPVAAESVDRARRALDIARREGDPDLELCTLGELGRALVAAGEVDEGLACVDEAMAGALGGECNSLDAVVAATCSMMVACDLAADLDRVAQWCDVADRFMHTYGCPFLYADCRMRYGSVLLTTGRWEEADRELQQAMQGCPPDNDYHRQARIRLADLRLRQGRLEEAEALLGESSEPLAACRVQAALWCARGEPELAASQLTRALGEGSLDDVEAVEAAGVLVEAHLDAGDVAAARAVVGRLDAARQGAPDGSAVAGHAALARGRVARMDSSHLDAVAAFEDAMGAFSAARRPYEVARSRVGLAEALAVEDPRAAVAEAQGAFATFERLGAQPAADETAALLRSLGAPARTGPKDVGVLTERQQEVLRLVGQGLSNPEIAERLFISPKTASHHVSSILTQLGLRNRVEAAAYATRWLSDTAVRGGQG